MSRDDTSCLVYRIKEHMEKKEDSEVGNLMFKYQFTRITTKKGQKFNSLDQLDNKKKILHTELLSFLESACKAKHSEYILIVLYSIERLNYQSKDNTLYIPNLNKCLRLLVSSGNYTENKDRVLKCLKIFFGIYTPYSELKLHDQESQIEKTFWKFFREKFGSEFMADLLDLCKFLFSIRYTVLQQNVNKLAHTLFYKAKSGSIRSKYRDDFNELIRKDTIKGFQKRQLIFPKDVYESKEYGKSKLHFIDNFPSIYKKEKALVDSLLDIKEKLDKNNSVSVFKDIEAVIRKYLEYRTLKSKEKKDFFGYKTRDSITLAIINEVMNDDFFKDYLKILSESEKQLELDDSNTNTNTNNNNNNNNYENNENNNNYENENNENNYNNNENNNIIGGKKKKRKTQRKTKRGNRKTKKKSRKKSRKHSRKRKHSRRK